jgi:hypothetical protein
MHRRFWAPLPHPPCCTRDISSRIYSRHRRHRLRTAITLRQQCTCRIRTFNMRPCPQAATPTQTPNPLPAPIPGTIQFQKVFRHTRMRICRIRTCRRLLRATPVPLHRRLLHHITGVRPVPLRHAIRRISIPTALHMDRDFGTCLCFSVHINTYMYIHITITSGTRTGRVQTFKASAAFPLTMTSRP